MLKNLIYVLILAPLISNDLFACTLCIGQDSRDKKYFIIIGIFILLIYFPMFYLFKTFIKYKNINNRPPNE